MNLEDLLETSMRARLVKGTAVELLVTAGEVGGVKHNVSLLNLPYK